MGARRSRQSLQPRATSIVVAAAIPERSLFFIRENRLSLACPGAHVIPSALVSFLKCHKLDRQP